MILKIGSTGEKVKDLQRFLKITADGSFGKMTEAAVKEWQKQNGLVADGIVGPKTLNAMGLLDTDKSEVTIPDSLNLIRSWLPTKEYFAGPTKKEWIFLHHTAGWHSPYQTISGWAADTRGQVATEFVLGGPSIKGNDYQYDGTLVQAFPDGGYAWHLTIGNNEMHRNSVGIEVCNFGFLTKGGYKNGSTLVARDPNKFYTYVGTEANQSQVVELKETFRGHKFWHAYSEKQIKVLKDWILWVANRDGIDPRKGLVPLIKKVGANKAFDTCDPNMCIREKGLWLHTNVVLGKVDLFPQENLVEMLLSL